MIEIPPHLIHNLIKRALAEDIGHGDITTTSIVPEEKTSEGKIIAKEGLVLCGLYIAEGVFRALDRDATVSSHFKDGDTIRKGEIIAGVSCNTKALLTGERTALNIMQRLSGIATLTSRFVEQIKGTGARIVDTRKTTPMLRAFEKYAVRCGGGLNHRFGLYDAVLIKDNHIVVAGGITSAVRHVREILPHTVKIEVETKKLDEVKEAVEAKVDIIMLDNMGIDEIKKAVSFIRSTRNSQLATLIEASGSINLDNVRDVALAGVDFISVGALTHSAPAVDISLEVS